MFTGTPVSKVFVAFGILLTADWRSVGEQRSAPGVELLGRFAECGFFLKIAVSEWLSYARATWAFNAGRRTGFSSLVRSGIRSVQLLVGLWLGPVRQQEGFQNLVAPFEAVVASWKVIGIFLRRCRLFPRACVSLALTWIVPPPGVFPWFRLSTARCSWRTVPRSRWSGLTLTSVGFSLRW